MLKVGWTNCVAFKLDQLDLILLSDWPQGFSSVRPPGESAVQQLLPKPVGRDIKTLFFPLFNAKMSRISLATARLPLTHSLARAFHTPSSVAFKGQLVAASALPQKNIFFF